MWRLPQPSPHLTPFSQGGWQGAGIHEIFVGPLGIFNVTCGRNCLIRFKRAYLKMKAERSLISSRCVVVGSKLKQLGDYRF